MSTDALSTGALPLTPEQRAILFDSLNEGEGAYAVQLRCALKPYVPEVFSQAWENVVARHTALRMRIRWAGQQQPSQSVQTHPPVGVRCTEVRGSDPAGLRELALKIFDEEFARPVNLEALRLVTPSVVHAGDQGYVAWTTHHLVLDGQSSRLLLAEIATEYDHLLAGVPRDVTPAASYADFVRWRLARAQNQVVAPRGDHDPGAALLAALGARPSPGAHRRSLRPFPEGMTGRMRRYAKGAGVTMASQFHAAWALAMGRIAGTQSVRLGTTSYGRPADLPGSADMLGMFTVTRGVQVALPRETATEQWAAAFQRSLVGVWDGQETAAALGHAPVVVVSHYPPTDVFRGRRSDFSLEILDVVDATPHPLVATVFIADPAMVVLNVNGVTMPEHAPDRLVDEVFRQLDLLIDTRRRSGRLADQLDPFARPEA